MKRKTLFDILLLLLLISLSLFTIFIINNKRKSGCSILVKCRNDNEEIFSLKDDGVYEINNGTHTIEIKSGKVKVLSSPCKDKICMNTGWISKEGESIVCLPYSITITVLGKGEDDFIL